MFPTVNNASIKDLSSALAVSKVQSEAPSNAGKAFIRFDYKTGSYSYGRDQEDITNDNIVVNTSSFVHGWVLWTNGTPSKVQRSFVEELPGPMPNNANGDQPSESRGFEARFEDDPETVLVFETSSYGGRKGCDALLNAIRIRSAGGEQEYLFPIVQLGSESYKSKQGGTIHNPMFNIVGWMNQAGETEESQAKLDAPEEPVKRRRRNA